MTTTTTTTSTDTETDTIVHVASVATAGTMALADTILDTAPDPDTASTTDTADTILPTTDMTNKTGHDATISQSADWNIVQTPQSIL